MQRSARTDIDNFLSIGYHTLKNRLGIMAKKLTQGKVHTYTVLFEPAGKGYNITFPAIPEICTFGETLREARVMAKDALRCFLESAKQELRPLPKDAVAYRERVRLTA